MKKKREMEPAATVIRMLGGAAAVAEFIGVSRFTVWRWTRPRSRKTSHGTNGRVPSEYQLKLLEWAEAQGIPLTAELMVRGPVKPKRLRR